MDENDSESVKARNDAAKAVLRLAALSRNPKLIAKAIENDIPLDTTSVLISTAVIHEALLKEGYNVDGVQMIIKEACTGIEYVHSTSSNPSKVVRLVLENGHYSIEGTVLCLTLYQYYTQQKSLRIK